MRATTSLPEPVGPSISTEMSDLAAVRIHSKTTSIFSSRPIISRKRCTDGDWSSVLTAARRSRKWSSRSADRVVGRPLGRVARRLSPESAGRRRSRPARLTQFSTSSRSRPNVCINYSTSKLSSGRELK